MSRFGGITGRILALTAFFAVASPALTRACDNPALSTGQSLYVPAYSHISHYFSTSKMQTCLLSVTLSVRNTDPHHCIKITRVDYYETGGKLLKACLDSAAVLDPLGTLEFAVPENDASGGSGANFVVKWSADKCTNLPIVESIMIGTRPLEGISFTSRGQVIVDTEK